MTIQEIQACTAPEYRQNEFMVYATLRQHQVVEELNGKEGIDGELNGELSGELNGELNSAQRVTLEFIQEHPGCKAIEISDKLSIPFSTIDKHIRVLLKGKQIERRGSKKTGGYYAV